MELDIERKVCFICGEGKADSVDHVPPKNLFLPKYRSMGENLITVPAHRECNNGTSKDDEYFRFCLLTQAMWTSELAKELWDEKYKVRIHDPNKAGYKKAY
ncbi:MAG: hypothetical protein K0S24_3060 [Sphingobacterium sp.]|jgi:hypothetical protein|nr:hypothetical protein [Sphingobacterium sp.]